MPLFLVESVEGTIWHLHRNGTDVFSIEEYRCHPYQFLVETGTDTSVLLASINLCDRDQILYKYPNDPVPMEG